MLRPVARAAGRRRDATRQREIAERGGRRRSTLLRRQPAGARAAGARADDERARRRRTSRPRRHGARIASAGFADEDALEVARVLGAGHGALRRGRCARWSPGRSSSRALRRVRARAPLPSGRRAADAARRPRGSSTSSRCTCSRCCAATRSRRSSGARGQVSTTRSETAVAFADLVGFTELGETVDGRGARRRRRAAVAAGGRGRRAAGAARQADRRRGDARLARRPSRCVERRCLALDRARRGRGRASRRCAPGVACGPAVHRWGDWFGSTGQPREPADRAARGPATVLVSDEVARRASTARFAWSDAGAKKLKGFSAAGQDLPAARATESTGDALVGAVAEHPVLGHDRAVEPAAAPLERPGPLAAGPAAPSGAEKRSQPRRVVCAASRARCRPACPWPGADGAVEDRRSRAAGARRRLREWRASGCEIHEQLASSRAARTRPATPTARRAASAVASVMQRPPSMIARDAAPAAGAISAAHA